MAASTARKLVSTQSSHLPTIKPRPNSSYPSVTNSKSEGFNKNNSNRSTTGSKTTLPTTKPRPNSAYPTVQFSRSDVSIKNKSDLKNTNSSKRDDRFIIYMASDVERERTTTAPSPLPVTRGRKKKSMDKSWRVDPESKRKGQVIEDARNAENTLQFIRERFALWPTGDEIIPLLMLLKSDQICANYCPSAVTPVDEVDSEQSPSLQDLQDKKGESSGSAGSRRTSQIATGRVSYTSSLGRRSQLGSTLFGKSNTSLGHARRSTLPLDCLGSNFRFRSNAQNSLRTPSFFGRTQMGRVLEERTPKGSTVAAKASIASRRTPSECKDLVTSSVKKFGKKR